MSAFELKNKLIDKIKTTEDERILEEVFVCWELSQKISKYIN